MFHCVDEQPCLHQINPVEVLISVFCRVKGCKHQILDIRIPANIRNDQGLHCQSPLFRGT